MIFQTPDSNSVSYRKELREQLLDAELNGKTSNEKVFFDSMKEGPFKYQKNEYLGYFKEQNE